MGGERDLDAARPYAFGVAGGDIDPAPVLRSLIDDLRAGHRVGPMAAGFHLAVAELIARVAVDLRALGNQPGPRSAVASSRMSSCCA